MVNSKINNSSVNSDNENLNLRPSIYPNPTNSTINIEFYYSLKTELILQIFSAFGSQVYNKELRKGISNTKESLVGLNPGIYFLMIKSKSNQILHSQNLIISNHD